MNEEREKTLGHEGEGSQDATFERGLTAALRPLRLPEGFADRVLAQVKEDGPHSATPRARVIPFGAWRVVGGAAIAATLIGGVFAVKDVREHRDREHRQAVATQQFETATRITDQVLAHTREELQRSGVLWGD